MVYFYEFIILNWEHIKMCRKWEKKEMKCTAVTADLKRTVTNGYSAPTISVT